MSDVEIAQPRPAHHSRGSHCADHRDFRNAPPKVARRWDVFTGGIGLFLSEMSTMLPQFWRARRCALLGAALIVFGAGSALAAEPWGEWLVAEKTARIRIADCMGVLWGVVSWEADPGVDSKNPDPALRTRPTTGMPILLGMKPSAPDRWDGRIYNSENGKFYSGGVTLLGMDSLRVRGCILGFLCGGENWTRAKDTPPAEPDAAICSRLPR
jgi:uncharacterized protein (DUF2147 family)